MKKVNINLQHTTRPTKNNHGDIPMSLSQASSPEEIKRDIKLQVFLAMNNKFSSAQTDRLIEDMGKVTDDIMGKSSSTVDMSLPQEFVESVRNKPMAGRCAGVSAEKEAQTPIEVPKAAIAVGHKRVLCFGGSMDGQSVIVDCGKMGAPFEQLIKPGVYLDEPYYLHKLIIGYDVLSKVYYFYSCKKEFKELLPQSVANTLARLIEFHKEDPMNNI